MTSGQEKLLLILVVLLQACLLLARSIRISEQPPRETASTDSPCSPDQYQQAMDRYYNELNTANVANSFNGNMLYYSALRAMQVNENGTDPATITEEDRELIENIGGQSRFKPAGMETANKVICAKILKEMDNVVHAISSTALCPWDYDCDYKANRFPNYLFNARCLKPSCSDANCSRRNSRKSICNEHTIFVNVYKMEGNCSSWTWVEEALTLACTCSNS